MVGFILGACLMNVYISREFEEQIAKNHALENELINAQQDLDELKGRLEQQQRKKIVTKIQPHIEIVNGQDRPTFETTSAKLDGEKKIQELLESLKGQEVIEVNYILIPKIIDGREFESEGRRYVLKVDVVVLSEELIVYATAELIKRETSTL